MPHNRTMPRTAVTTITRTVEDHGHQIEVEIDYEVSPVSGFAGPDLVTIQDVRVCDISIMYHADNDLEFMEMIVAICEVDYINGKREAIAA